MKSVVAVLAVLLLAAPVFAEEVPQATLSSLGLGGMQTMSDSDGMQVRGMAGSFVRFAGSSLISGQLATPDALNFVTFNSLNTADGNGETTAASGTLSLNGTHDVGVAQGNPITLNVTFPDGSSYMGSIMGQVGGLSSASIVQP